MVKNIFAVFVMAAITAVLSTVAWGCEVRSGANRGWVYSGDAAFYYDEHGEEYSGMHVMPEDGTRRYFDEETHIMATGETVIDGSKYMFDADGVMMTGFQTVNGALRYYSVETGIMKTGWYKSDEGTFYFDLNTGNAASDWTEIDGSLYYFSPILMQFLRALCTIIPLLLSVNQKQ